MNLLVTCNRNMEEETCDEIFEILGEMGDEEPKIEKSSFSGIVLVNTNIDPYLVTNHIKNTILEEPWRIRYSNRFIPISISTITNISDILKAVKEQIYRMKQDDTYRITIEKRGSAISSQEIIKAVADIIPNKVSLERHDWNIMVQILGGITGVSILNNNNIASVLKIKRDSTE